MFPHQKGLRAIILAAFVVFFWLFYVVKNQPLNKRVRVPPTPPTNETDTVPPSPTNTHEEGRRITTVLAHIEGFTVFENLYLRNGTLFVVHPDSASLNSTAQANGYPIRKNILTKPIIIKLGVDGDPRDQVSTH